LRLAARPASPTRRRAWRLERGADPRRGKGPEGETSGALRVAARRPGKRGGEQTVEGVEWCSRERAPHETLRTEGGEAGRLARVESSDNSKGRESSARGPARGSCIPDPPRSMRCRGPKSRRGELGHLRAARRARAGRQPSGRPEGARETRAVTERSGEPGRVRSGPVERRSSGRRSRSPGARGKTGTPPKRACRVRRTSTDATSHTLVL